MTVKELIDYLKDKCHPNDVVVLSSDSEGNDFSPLAGGSAGYCRIDPKRAWVANYFEEKVEGEVETTCICLWPTR
jgi:hypothetical protein